MASHDQAAPRSRDFLARPLSAILWWGLPLAAGWSADFLPITQTATTLVWTAALAWMGAGCTLNARRCHRLHCYVSAPVLFLGAIGTLAAALGFAPFGPHTASYVIHTTLVLALSTFLVEPVWGKYRSR
ncbi:conserved hypothetical protein [Phenylobacterium zucineum HLK1]|uniref:Uncharacterized protein n=1 Tax=Phenylobacterium zucineum (strain HLK1) TaxID=450851 RepID=B4RAA1_PHEZH|nr:hypothetical protein [Phenylobacterium zucineum]ACG77908.1 conserved hypothetical protein [Phenylobacterium zucineum HLK1]